MIYLNFDKTKKRSYVTQIYSAMREKILLGELLAGEALPSSRELCQNLSVARNTVLSAYDMLVAEGVVYSVAGSGFYVSPSVHSTVKIVPIKNQQTASLTDLVITDDIINYDSGLPAISLFPRAKWNRAVSRVFLEAPISALGYDDPQGRPELREVLCDYLKKTRGIACSPQQIIITSGAKQGLSLVAKCLLSSKSEVWIEDPSNFNVKQIFSYHTDNIIPFEVDQQGIRPEQFPSEEKPDLIFVTPSHQFPMGGILPFKRRIALVEFARKTGAYILEDEYDSIFTYDSPPVNSLFELDSEHVIYVGTFSKVMFPSIRLGYLVVPEQLVSKIRELKRLADHHSNSIYQLALMHFIESGELERHIRHMKKEYRKRHDILLEKMDAMFGEMIQIHGAEAGMHVIVEFDKAIFSEEMINQLFQAGVYVVPVERHTIQKGNHKNQIIMGYTGMEIESLLRGLEVIKNIIIEYIPEMDI